MMTDRGLRAVSKLLHLVHAVRDSAKLRPRLAANPTGVLLRQIAKDGSICLRSGRGHGMRNFFFSIGFVVACATIGFVVACAPNETKPKQPEGPLPQSAPRKGQQAPITSASTSKPALDTQPILETQPKRAPGPSISMSAKKNICASEFAAGNADISVFRDNTQEVKLLVLEPDIGRFHHAPWTYYDSNGKQLLMVPERPMSPEERAKDPVIQKMEALKKGLIADETGISCP